MAELDLIADIGGTHARFALTDPAAPAPRVLQAQTLRGADFPSLRHAAAHYLARVGAKPRRAAFALAAVVDADADAIFLTNRAWSFGRDALRRALGLDELRLLNDFGAIAWAVPELGPGDRVALHGDADAPLRAPVSVLGPGTGFGVALLVGSRERGWQAVETEGGHASFAPLDDEERRIARWIEARCGRVSTERLLSGAGLSHIDAALRGVPDGSDDGVREPAAIVGAALQGRDPHAERALARFCAVLGSVAGDIALIHGARTLMIAGGIVPRFVPFLRASAFRERFLAKGRFAAYMEAVAVHVITHPQPGLLGAAVALRRPAA
ncbi:MAG: glucokinase [Mizugakiibacter sp.]|uniref:glucokinase n=1 Tax=Mizugakiibacter sp. TaxID=1972610 RepID=UPI0031C74012|nr:glucokinase [Xanthomonadaceae bacterium]